MCLTNVKWELQELTTLNYYVSLITNETKNIKNLNKLCPTAKKVLMKKWESWIVWYLDLATNLLKKDMLPEKLNQEKLKQDILNFEMKNKEKILKKIKGECHSLISVFFEIHSLLVYEFADTVAGLTTKDLNILEFIEKVGELLHLLCINSIFEMVEINIDCVSKCELVNDRGNDPLSIKLFINNSYNINAFGFKKLTKLSQLLKIDLEHNIKLILDFKYYEGEITEKIKSIVKFAKELFKNVEIQNLDKDKIL